jgi:ABC-type multidrug transport system ATPase subunit
MTTRTTTTIEAAELAKVYGDGTRALAGISFAAEAGEIFGLLGPNGSGKTTAVRIFVTLLQATSGAARVAGYDVGRNRERVRQLIGYSGQYVGVDQDLTVTENLILSGRLHGLSESQARGRSDELVERLGLGGVAGQRAGRLSGGMRRRLDLAQAMVHRPAALFLDEPTTGLDPQARNALWEELRALSATGTTILLTTQYLEEADRLCGRVAILDRGRILTVGTPTALKDAAGEDRVTLTLAEPGDPDQRVLAQRVAAQVPGVVNVRYGQQEVTLQLRAAGDALLELIRRLDLEGVDVARLRLAPTTLDDVFVAYTGESPRSEVESGRRPSSVFAAIHGGTSR